MKLANAAVEIIGNGWAVQDFLIYFGRCFIRAAGTFGYEKLMKVSLIFFYTVMSGPCGPLGDCIRSLPCGEVTKRNSFRLY